MLFFLMRFSFKQPEMDVYPTRKDLFQDTLLGKFFLLILIICYHPDLFFMWLHQTSLEQENRMVYL